MLAFTYCQHDTSSVFCAVLQYLVMREHTVQHPAVESQPRIMSPLLVVTPHIQTINEHTVLQAVSVDR